MEGMNLKRINELTAISRQRELTAEEQAERQQLRQEYLKAFRAQMRQSLDSTVVEYPDGSRVPLRETTKK
jgi:uncharacterized protein YnzC (UPF0291/DUF896 family)